jgi:hypothetical protein
LFTVDWWLHVLLLLTVGGLLLLLLVALALLVHLSLGLVGELVDEVHGDSDDGVVVEGSQERRYE